MASIQFSDNPNIAFSAMVDATEKSNIMNPVINSPPAVEMSSLLHIPSHTVFAPPSSIPTKSQRLADLTKQAQKYSDLAHSRKMKFCAVSSVAHPVTCVPFCFFFGAIYGVANWNKDSTPKYEPSETCQRAICPMDACDPTISSCITCWPSTDFLSEPERQEMDSITSEINKSTADKIAYQLRPTR